MGGGHFSGKSTVVEQVVQAFPSGSVKPRWTLLSDENKLYDQAKRQRLKYVDHSRVNIRNFLQAGWFDIQQNKENFGNGVPNIIQDGSFLITYFSKYKYYNVHEHGKVGKKDIGAFKALLREHPKPQTKLIYLDVELKERQRRFLNYIESLNGAHDPSITASDWMIVNNPLKFQRMEEIMQDTIAEFFDYEIFKTTHMSKKEVCDKALDVIGLSR
ncbi:MAG: hypothetical protein FWE16_03980 [Firmicutes bacterium]|nr:hypothetical protein [Bacillota bacterium]